MIFFSFHIGYSLELIALALGVALLIYLKTIKNKLKKTWALVAAWVVIVISSLMIICTTYQMIVYWTQGYKYQMMHKKDGRTSLLEDAQKNNNINNDSK